MKHRDKLEPLSYFDKLYILRGKNRALAIAQGKPVVLDRLALRRHVNEYYAAHPGLAAAPDPVWEAVLTNGEAPIDVICRAAGDFSRPAAPAPFRGGARPSLAPADGFPNCMRGQCGHPAVRPVVTTDVKAVFGILRTKMYENVYLCFIIYKKVLRVWHKYDRIRSKIYVFSKICFFHETRN